MPFAVLSGHGGEKQCLTSRLGIPGSITRSSGSVKPLLEKGEGPLDPVSDTGAQMLNAKPMIPFHAR